MCPHQTKTHVLESRNSKCILIVEVWTDHASCFFDDATSHSSYQGGGTLQDKIVLRFQFGPLNFCCRNGHCCISGVSSHGLTKQNVSRSISSLFMMHDL